MIRKSPPPATRTTILSRIAAPALAVLGAAAISIHAGELPAGAALGDSFALKAGRTADSELNGQELEIGEGVWKASPGTVFSAEGSVTSNLGESDNGACVGEVKLPALSNSPVILLQADIKPAGSDWVALALTEKGNIADFWHDAMIWVMFRPDGRCEVRLNGTETVLFSSKGPAPEWEAGASNHVELAYDQEKNALTVTLNRHPLLENASLEFTPKIGYAAFFIQKPSGAAPSVDNFSVSAGGSQEQTALPGTSAGKTEASRKGASRLPSA